MALVFFMLPSNGCRPPVENAAAGRITDASRASPPVENLNPLQVARAFNVACKRGDHKTALRLARIDSRTERELVRSVVDVGTATERLKKAVAERFGPDAEYETDFGLPYDEEFDDAVQRVRGDEALVIMAAWKDVKDPDPDSGSGVTRLTLRAGHWLVEVHPRKATDQEIRGMATLNQHLVRAAHRTLRDLKAGKYTAPSDVGGALRSELR